jgi:hypothetical protein
MKKAALIAVACTAAALLAGHGLAQTSNAPPAPAQRPSTAPMKPSSSDRSSPFTVEGEVTKVDAKKGWVDVKTAEGRMKLHYPPPALDNVKNGDRVTVEIGMRTVK